MVGAAVGSGEQGVFPPEGDGPHGTLDNVGIQFEAPIVEESEQTLPMVEGVADRLRQLGAAGQPAELLAQPNLQSFDQRAAALLAFVLTVFCGLAADIALDRIERADPLQRLMRNRRLGGEV